MAQAQGGRGSSAAVHDQPTLLPGGTSPETLARIAALEDALAEALDRIAALEGAEPQPGVTPAVAISAGISPATGPEGTAFTITPATFTGTPNPIVTHLLMLGATDVTSQIVGNGYTSTARGTLTLTHTGTNASGITTSAATATEAPPVHTTAPWSPPVPASRRRPPMGAHPP